VRVGPNESIQQAVDRSGPGDTIEVPYAIYHESVVLDWSDVTLIGIANENGDWPVIDGEGTRSDGVIASGNNFEMAFFDVKNYTSNGVLVEGATGVYLHDMYIENTGVSGVYPVRCTDVLMERIEATLMNDAAIYAGKSENVVIRDTVTYGNVIGIELENTVNGEIYNNHAHDNTVGIFVDLLPQLPSKVSLFTKVHDNVVENNNGENFAKPGTSPALIPQVSARDCSSSAFPKARSSRIGCILTCGSAPGSWVKSAWPHLRPNAHDWSRSARYACDYCLPMATTSRAS